MKKVLSLCVMCLLTLSAMSQKTVWVDLDLPSGTKWKSVNESGEYSYESAIDNFGKYVPTKEQWQELRTFCVWTWQEDGYRVTGNNGNSIFLPADGYWSSTPFRSGYAWGFSFTSSSVLTKQWDCGYRCSVRLVQ